VTPAPSMASFALVPSCSAEAIQAERDAVVRWAGQVAELIAAAPTSAPPMFVDAHRGRGEPFNVAAVTQEADARAWDRMLRESGLWSFMDQTAREQWREQIQGPRYHGQHTKVPELPPFTVQAAEDMARSVHADRGRMVARGVEEVHRRLSGLYRSNEVARFGPRMVIKGIGSCWGTGKWLHISHEVCDKLDDLARFLRLARGQAEDDHRRGCWNQLSSAAHSAPCVVQMEFWTVKLFKNGNGHLWFRWDEDVDRLNRMLAAAGQGCIPDTEPAGRPR
jgi:hypothetical protein